MAKKKKMLSSVKIQEIVQDFNMTSMGKDVWNGHDIILQQCGFDCFCKEKHFTVYFSFYDMFGQADTDYSVYLILMG